MDLSGVTPLDGIEIIGASDVRNPLLGVAGAAHVFGPQKGASPADVLQLERGLDNLQRLAPDGHHLSASPGAGSAGGLGFAVLLLGGVLTSGAQFVLDLLDFSTHASSADIIVTGEGSLDAQTGDGKLISIVTARSAGVPVMAVVGRNALGEDALSALGLSSVFAISQRTDIDTSNDSAASALILRKIGKRSGPSSRKPLMGSTGGGAMRRWPNSSSSSSGGYGGT